jgi:hypothetical protein
MHDTAGVRASARGQGPAPRLHRDGTVSYFSYDLQDWVRRTIYVPREELEALRPAARARVLRHLGEESAAPTA